MYERRGDDQAVGGDAWLTWYTTGGTYAAPTGLTMLESHDMTHDSNPPWVTHTEDVGVLDNSSFLLTFRSDTVGTGVDYRVDEICVNGSPI